MPDDTTDDVDVEQPQADTEPADSGAAVATAPRRSSGDPLAYLTGGGTPPASARRRQTNTSDPLAALIEHADKGDAPSGLADRLEYVPTTGEKILNWTPFGKRTREFVGKAASSVVGMVEGGVQTVRSMNQKAADYYDQTGTVLGQEPTGDEAPPVPGDHTQREANKADDKTLSEIGDWLFDKKKFLEERGLLQDPAYKTTIQGRVVGAVGQAAPLVAASANPYGLLTGAGYAALGTKSDTYRDSKEKFLEKYKKEGMSEDEAKEKAETDAQDYSNAMAAATIPEMMAFMGAGKVASNVVAKLAADSPAWRQFLASAVAAYGANAASGTAGSHIKEALLHDPVFGKDPNKPAYSLEQFVQDALFGLMHAKHATGEMQLNKARKEFVTRNDEQMQQQAENNEQSRLAKAYGDEPGGETEAPYDDRTPVGPPTGKYADVPDATTPPPLPIRPPSRPELLAAESKAQDLEQKGAPQTAAAIRQEAVKPKVTVPEARRIGPDQLTPPELEQAVKAGTMQVHDIPDEMGGGKLFMPVEEQEAPTNAHGEELRPATSNDIDQLEIEAQHYEEFSQNLDAHTPEQIKQYRKDAQAALEKARALDHSHLPEDEWQYFDEHKEILRDAILEMDKHLKDHADTKEAAKANEPSKNPAGQKATPPPLPKARPVDQGEVAGSRPATGRTDQAQGTTPVSSPAEATAKLAEFLKSKGVENDLPGATLGSVTPQADGTVAVRVEVGDESHLVAVKPGQKLSEGESIKSTPNETPNANPIESPVAEAEGGATSPVQAVAEGGPAPVQEAPRPAPKPEEVAQTDARKFAPGPRAIVDQHNEFLRDGKFADALMLEGTTRNQGRGGLADHLENTRARAEKQFGYEPAREEPTEDLNPGGVDPNEALAAKKTLEDVYRRKWMNLSDEEFQNAVDNAFTYALKNFDPTKGAAFKTSMEWKLKRTLIDQHRKIGGAVDEEGNPVRREQSADSEPGQISLNDEEAMRQMLTQRQLEEAEEVARENKQLNETMDAFRESLSPADQRLFDYYWAKRTTGKGSTAGNPDKLFGAGALDKMHDKFEQLIEDYKHDPEETLASLRSARPVQGRSRPEQAGANSGRAPAADNPQGVPAENAAGGEQRPVQPEGPRPAQPVEPANPQAAGAGTPAVVRGRLLSRIIDAPEGKYGADTADLLKQAKKAKTPDELQALSDRLDTYEQAPVQREVVPPNDAAAGSESGTAGREGTTAGDDLGRAQQGLGGGGEAPAEPAPDGEAGVRRPSWIDELKAQVAKERGEPPPPVEVPPPKIEAEPAVEPSKPLTLADLPPRTGEAPMLPENNAIIDGVINDLKSGKITRAEADKIVADTKAQNETEYDARRLAQAEKKRVASETAKTKRAEAKAEAEKPKSPMPEAAAKIDNIVHEEAKPAKVEESAAAKENEAKGLPAEAPARKEATAPAKVGRVLTVVDADKLPTPPDYVEKGKYHLFEEQRFSINSILHAIKRGLKGYLDADGVGVGKGRIAMGTAIEANEIAKPLGKKVLVLTASDKLIKKYINDLAAMSDIFASTKLQHMPVEVAVHLLDQHGIVLAKYDDLRRGVRTMDGKKLADDSYHTVIADEAHKLKNSDSQTAQAFMNLKRDFTAHLTATPFDRVKNAEYFLPDVTGERIDVIRKKLGYYMKTEYDRDGNPTKKVATPIGNQTWEQIAQHVIDLRGDMIKNGQAVRRAYPFYGEINEVRLPHSLSDMPEHEAYDIHYADAAFNQRGNLVQQMARWTESQKADHIEKMIHESLAKGEKPVIFSETVNDPKPMEWLQGHEQPKGLLTELQRRLEAKGIKVAKIYGGNDKKIGPEVEKFQKGEADVALASKQNGVGIDLDDQTGDRPRHLILASPLYSGNDYDQILGRVSRAGTKSPSRVSIIMSDSHSDYSRRETMDRKLEVLHAIQGGKDVDLAQFEEGQGIENVGGFGQQKKGPPIPGPEKQENIGHEVERIPGGGITRLDPNNPEHVARYAKALVDGDTSVVMKGFGDGLFERLRRGMDKPITREQAGEGRGPESRKWNEQPDKLDHDEVSNVVHEEIAKAEDIARALGRGALSPRRKQTGSASIAMEPGGFRFESNPSKLIEYFKKWDDIDLVRQKMRDAMDEEISHAVDIKARYERWMKEGAPGADTPNGFHTWGVEEGKRIVREYASDITGLRPIERQVAEKALLKAYNSYENANNFGHYHNDPDVRVIHDGAAFAKEVNEKYGGDVLKAPDHMFMDHGELMKFLEGTPSAMRQTGAEFLRQMDQARRLGHTTENGYLKTIKSWVATVVDWMAGMKRVAENANYYSPSLGKRLAEMDIIRRHLENAVAKGSGVGRDFASFQKLLGEMRALGESTKVTREQARPPGQQQAPPPPRPTPKRDFTAEEHLTQEMDAVAGNKRPEIPELPKPDLGRGGVFQSMQKIKEAVGAAVPKLNDWGKLKLWLSGEQQMAKARNRAMVESVLQAIPERHDRVVANLWADHGGDRELLTKARDEAAARGDRAREAQYVDALNIRPDLQAKAEAIRKYYDAVGAEGIKEGWFKEFRKDYVHRVTDNPVSAMLGIKRGMGRMGAEPGLGRRPSFTRAREFETISELEKAGYKLRSDDIAENLAAYADAFSNYHTQTKLIKAMRAGRAMDNKPLLSFSNRAPERLPSKPTEQQRARYEKADRSGYRRLEGVPTATPLYFHPHVAREMNNLFRGSAYAKWLREVNPEMHVGERLAKAGLLGLDKATRMIKRGMFGGPNPFHMMTVGSRVLGTVNPFTMAKAGEGRKVGDVLKDIASGKGIEPFDPNNADHADAIAHGLKLHGGDYKSTELFHDGVLANNKDAFQKMIVGAGKLAEKIPGVGKTKAGEMARNAAESVSNLWGSVGKFTFDTYIPALKLDTYAKNLKINEAHFAKDLASGKVTKQEVKALTADQVNNMFGDLNETVLARNPTIQHIMRSTILAPDFLWSTLKYMGQAGLGAGNLAVNAVQGKFSGGAHYAQARSLLAATALYAIATQIFDTLADGKPHLDDPLAFHYKNRRYSIRSVLGDAVHAVQDPFKFAAGRESPSIKYASTALAGRNYRGEKINQGQAFQEALMGGLPIMFRGLTTQLTKDVPGIGQYLSTETDRQNPTTPVEQTLGAMGFHVKRTSPVFDAYALARNYKKAQGIAEDTGVYPVGKYQQLRYALEDGNTERAEAVMRKMMEDPKTKAGLVKGFTQSVDHPYTGNKAMDIAMKRAATPEQRDILNTADKTRAQMKHDFFELLKKVQSK